MREKIVSLENLDVYGIYVFYVFNYPCTFIYLVCNEESTKYHGENTGEI